MTIQDFINSNNGKELDFDGAYGPQCVDLIQFYNRDVLDNSQPFTGDAKDIYGQQPDKFDWIANTPDGVPQPGDIVIWRANGVSTGPAGHVDLAFYPSDTDIYTGFDQNWGGHSYCELIKHGYQDVIGWGRYKLNVPTPTPVQEDTLDLETATELAYMAAGRDGSDPANIADLETNHVGKPALDEIKSWYNSPERADYLAAERKKLADCVAQVKTLTATVTSLEAELAATTATPPPPVPTVPPTSSTPPAPTGIHPKVKAAGTAGAVSALIFAVLQSAGVQIQPDIATALTALMSFLGGYFVSTN